MNDHAICLNCANWDLANAVKLPVYQKGKLVCHREYAACKMNAVIPDAGECLPMMGADGNCQGFETEAFRPSEDFLAWQHEVETQNDGLDIPQLDPAELRPRAHVA